MSIVNCSQCLSQGVTNRCYISGYNTKCGHDNGWALTTNKSGSSYVSCKSCSGNNCYITGYDIKCGHDNGWAYVPSINANANATCTSCSKQLNGKWSMESNASNNSYFNTTTGRYLGISDGYFLYSGNPNWVYSYCKPCWIVQIKNILPTLGIGDTAQINQLNNKITQLQSAINIKQNQKTQLKNKLTASQNKNIIKQNQNVQLKQKLTQKQTKLTKQQNKNITKQNQNNQLKQKLTQTQTKYNNLYHQNQTIKHQLSIIRNQNQDLKQNQQILQNSIALQQSRNQKSFIHILQNILNDLGINQLKQLFYCQDIGGTDLLQNFFNVQNLAINVIEDIKCLIKKNISNIVVEMEDRVRGNLANINEECNQVTKNIQKLKQSLISMNLPEKVMNQSLKPLQNYLNELKQKNLKLNLLK